ncbi:MAG TPA: RNA polymerase sigma factor [Symbiobacteriaceae bacterium]|nr:RNA polymerase sigma factor [Symbiobacteriaceae bacterium]
MIRDEELCRQLQAGNEAAMEALVHRHHRAIFAFLYRQTGDAHTADDLAQECFIRLCTRIGSYRYPDPFLPWLYTIAHNLYKDWRKNAWQRKVVPLEQPEPSSGTAPIDLLERYADRAEVVRALGALDEAHRSALVLRYYQDLTVPQIARIEGVPEGTVKSRLSIALRRLRDLLSRERGVQNATD